MNIHKNLEPIAVNVHFGETYNYDKKVLKAYKCESELKRAVKAKENLVRHHLLNKHGISFLFDIKVTEKGEPPMVETFSIIDLINSKLTSANSSVCFSTYEIYREKGIEEAISSLHQSSNLTII